MRRFYALCLALVALLVAAPAAFAQTCTTSWTNASGGAWETAANWSNGVPQASSVACITLDGTYTVSTSSADRALAGLVVGGSTGTQTLTVFNVFAVAGDVRIGARGVVDLLDRIPSGNDGLYAAGTVTVEGVLQQTSGTSLLVGAGTLDVAPGGVLRMTSGAQMGDASSRLRLRGEAVCTSSTCSINAPVDVDGGTLRAAGTGTQLVVRGGGRLFNAALEADAGSTLGLTRTGDVRYTVAGTTTGTPAGTVAWTGNTAFAAEADGATLAVAGTGLTLTGSTFLTSAGGAFRNTGRIYAPHDPSNFATVDGVTLRNAGQLVLEIGLGFRNAAVVHNEATGTVQTYDGGGFGGVGGVAGRFENAGLLRQTERSGTAYGTTTRIQIPYDGLPGSVLRAEAGSINVEQGGTLQDVHFEAAEGTSVAVGGSAALRVSGTLSGTPVGDVRLYRAQVSAGPSGATFAFGGTGLRLGSSVALVGGGVFNNTGLLVAPSEPSNFAALDGSLLRNEGRFVLDIGLGFRNGATLRNEAAGVVEFSPYGSIGGVGGAAGRLENAGRVVKTGSGTSSFSTVAVRTLPTGTYNAQNGRIDLQNPASTMHPAGTTLVGTNSYLAPVNFEPQGTVSPGTDVQPVAKLTWQGNFRPSQVAGSPRLVVDVDAGGRSDTLAAQPGAGNEVVRLAGALVVRVRPGFTPSVGDAWTILTSTSSATTVGQFAQIATENAPPGIAFVAEVAADRRSVVVRAVAVAPGGPITLSSTSLIGGGMRPVFASGPGATGVTTARLVCRECLDADSLGTIPATVVGGGEAVAELRFDLTSPRAFGLYDLVIQRAGLPDETTPFTVRPFVSYIHVLPSINRGIGVRAASTGQYNWSHYDVWNVSNIVAPAYTFGTVGRQDSSLVSFAVSTGNPFGSARVFFQSDTAPDPTEDALLFARVVPTVSVALSVGQRIEPANVRFPEQASTGPGDPRIPFGAKRLLTVFATQHTTFERARFVVEGALRTTGDAALDAYLARVDAADPNAVRTGAGDMLTAVSRYVGGSAELLANVLAQTNATVATPAGLAASAATPFDEALDRWAGWHYRDLDEAYRVDLATAPASVQALLQAEYDALLDPTAPPVAATGDASPRASLVTLDASVLARLQDVAPSPICSQIASSAAAAAKSAAKNTQQAAGQLSEAVCQMQPTIAGSAPSGPPPVSPTVGNVAANLVPTIRTVGNFVRNAAGQVGGGGNRPQAYSATANVQDSCGAGSGGGAGGSCGPPSAPADPNDKIAEATGLCELGTVEVDGVAVTRCVRHYVPLNEATRPVTYAIAFENLPQATANAEFVTVTDTLDANFDPASLAIVSTSSDSTFSFATNGNVVTFRFVGINLPPNRTAPEGQGHITYTVTPRPGLAEGTVLRNRAHIVFDYNPAIATPQVLHEIRAATDLAVVVQAADSVQTGQPVPVTATVANLQGDPSTETTVTITAGGQIVADATPTVGTCTGTGSTTVTCALGTLAPNTYEQVALTLAAPPSGRYALAASATTTAFDPFLANNEDAVNVDVVTVGIADEPGQGLPRAVTLASVSPNPARGAVRIRYGLPHPAAVQIQVFDLLGREVARLRTDTDAAGWHTADWNGIAASGVYVVRLQAQTGTETETRTRQLVLLR